MTSAQAHGDDQKDATYSLSDLLCGMVVISVLVGRILACITISWSGTETTVTCKPSNGVLHVRIVANSVPKRVRHTSNKKAATTQQIDYSTKSICAKWRTCFSATHNTCVTCSARCLPICVLNALHLKIRFPTLCASSFMVHFIFHSVYPELRSSRTGSSIRTSISAASRGGISIPSQSPLRATRMIARSGIGFAMGASCDRLHGQTARPAVGVANISHQSERKQ